MKRLLTLLFSTLLLSAVLCVSASASNYDAVAEDLAAIGMFRGTEKGFELDRAPTRSEAAIMLVRLYGAEDAAKTAYEAGEISHPFTDVSKFTSPYVAWLYSNGITNGYTETTYASGQACSARNYVVFLLRALGYKDGSDFQYAEALTFAQERGFYDPLLFHGDFLRDDLAALTYQGLAADMKEGENYLLKSLIDSGAIDKKAAAPMTEKIEAYRAMESAVSGIDENAMDMDIDMKMDLVMEFMGEKVIMPTDISGNMKMLTDGTDIRMAYEMTLEEDGAEATVSLWLKDGWQYVSVEEDGETYGIKAPVTDISAVLEENKPVDIQSMNVTGLALLKSVTAERVNADTMYTVVIDRSMGGLMEGVTDLIGETQELPSFEMSDITVSYTVSRNGELKKCAMEMAVSGSEDIPMEDGTVVPVSVSYDYDMDLTIRATGSKVKITYPDFSDFIEITEDEMSTIL